ncbi:MAG TPA: UvrD-helicase domain-containing protein [Nocardioidaceae bacterium]|nr:UvrD-helicase domain-containing protein [Nocardioidaceae bacterium]
MTAALDPAHFDITAALPTGTTLLEASAGTGKTWTIGALVARYVAEGRSTLDQMLVVTFGRAASQELRERVRAQLVEAEQALAGPGTRPARSDLLEVLLDADEEERALRRRRLREALAGFDAATIATTHQFCQLVLRGLGVAGDTDAQATLVDDLDDLLREVVDDVYLRTVAGHDEPPFSPGEALRLARAAVGDPQARLEPEDADPDTLPGRRCAFADAVRAELDQRKRRLGVLGYDDLLSELAAALREEDAPARQRMRQRWKVVLVDEFQDTDPVQWEVLDRAFTGHATMVLIGDPKQAIYAFRGGDVTTYLHAAGTATTSQTLGTNWRSDQALVDSLQVVLGGAALGDREIVVRDVGAANLGSRLTGAGAPFRLRVVRKHLLGRKPGSKLSVKAVREHVAADVARDIKRLLGSAARFDGRELRPRDVAVVAYRNADLQAIQQALLGVGVPAVVAGSGSVFATPAATEWLRLLEALEQPHRAARVRSAAMTCFIGCSAAELGGATGSDDTFTDRLTEQVRDWADLLASRGVVAVLEAASAGGLAARVLAREGGERLLTDIRHVGQALHEAAVTERLGLVALLTWLRGQIAEDRGDVADERTRRLDSDAAAVQLVTIHGSKGLEFPVVYLPSLWDRYPQNPAVPLFHAADDGGRRCIDVGGGGPHWEEHVRQARTEDDGESLRLLYVAMTRAKSQVVAWWAPAPKNTPTSALQRMLFGRRPGWPDVPPVRELHDEAKVAEILHVWQRLGGPVWEEAALAEPVPVEPDDDTTLLSVRRFERFVDTSWRRTSYSALSAAAEPAPGATSEPEDRPKDDEPELQPADRGGLRDEPGPARRPAADGPVPVPSPMGTLPVGTRFGSLVHAVLETADPQAADLRQEMLSRIGEQLVRWPVELDPVGLAEALVAVCDSPLGPLAGGTRLRDIGLRDRLCELQFELPLSGGDGRTHPAGAATLGEVAPLLRAHLPAEDPVRAYADALSEPRLGGQSLRGYLTGSVDVVLRVPRGDGVRYLVVDYKSNWLGGLPGDGQTLTSHDYRPEALRAAMGHSDYPLQALLYAVVLHRYLRWRQPGYDPGEHLGGVLYLYLRGMCGPDTPILDGEPCGVFSWRPPVALVEDLSDLLDGCGSALGSRPGDPA